MTASDTPPDLLLAEGGELVSPSVFQIRRLMRDLRLRIAEFSALMRCALRQSTPRQRADYLKLLAVVDQMGRQMQRSSELAHASAAAISHCDADMLVVLRDQLLGEIAAQQSSQKMPGTDTDQRIISDHHSTL